MYQLWFQWNLIVLSLFFFIIILIFGKYSLFTLLLILVLSYISQYSGYYYKKYFLNYPPYNKFTISRVFEMIPYGVTGLILGGCKIIKKLQSHKVYSLFFSIIVYSMIVNYNIFTDIIGVSYYGIKLNILSICIIIVFSLFPSDITENNFFKKTFSLITNYSGGIFYLHVSVYEYFQYFFENIKNGTFFGIIIIYLICYFICFMGMLIFGKTQLKFLFS